MFDLDLLVHMQIQISDELNARLERGDGDAYRQLELSLASAIQSQIPVAKLQIEDAGPYNDAGQWEKSKFHDVESIDDEEDPDMESLCWCGHKKKEHSEDYRCLRCTCQNFQYKES